MNNVLVPKSHGLLANNWIKWMWLLFTGGQNEVFVRYIMVWWWCPLYYTNMRSSMFIVLVHWNFCVLIHVYRHGSNSPLRHRCGSI